MAEKGDIRFPESCRGKEVFQALLNFMDMTVGGVYPDAVIGVYEYGMTGAEKVAVSFYIYKSYWQEFIFQL